MLMSTVDSVFPSGGGSGLHFHAARLSLCLQCQHMRPMPEAAEGNAPVKSSLLGANCPFKELQVRGAKFSGENQQMKRKSLTLAS